MKQGGTPSVAKWQGLGSPIALAESMRNHAKGMRQEFIRRGFPWPRLTHQISQKLWFSSQTIRPFAVRMPSST